MMKYIVDRIEKNIVICENQETKVMESFDISLFTEQVKDGDVVEKEDGKFKIIKEETKSRKEYIDELMKKLMK